MSHDAVQTGAKGFLLPGGRILRQLLKGFLHLEAPGPEVLQQLLHQQRCLGIAAGPEQLLHAVAQQLQAGHQCLYLLR